MLKFAVMAAILLTTSSTMAAEVPTGIASRYAELSKVFQKWDSKAFASFFAKDFILIDTESKKVNRKEFLQMVDGLMEGVTKIEDHEEFNGVTKLKGGVVAVKCDLKLMIAKPDGNLSVHEICTDYWKKVSGKWVMVKTIDWVFTVEPAQ
ncbi:MAG: nuclear transport factor 2 family protein [Armatimonadetes bacterium]|nr:nuclear transport factor 2 family protein [Armatimonadota bacterium]